MDTALHIACRYGHPETVKLFLQKGISSSARNKVIIWEIGIINLIILCVIVCIQLLNSAIIYKHANMDIPLANSYVISRFNRIS